MARILYTVDERGRPVPGFVEAPDLATAVCALAPRPAHEIRFWSHPFFGDAPGDDPSDAYARAQKATTWPSWCVFGAMLICLPGVVGFWLVAFGADGGRIGDATGPGALAAGAPIVCSFLGAVLLAPVAFHLMRQALADREHALALALVTVLQLSVLPLAPLFVLWRVRARAGRVGVEAALRPYRRLAALGLGGPYGFLRMQALDQLVLVDERIASLEERLARRASATDESDLALCLVLYRHDPDGAEAMLARSRDAAAGILGPAFRQMTRAFIAVERRSVTAASEVETARAEMARAASSVSGSLRPLFDSQLARAHAATGDVRAAEHMLARGAAPLLKSGEIHVLDRAAADVALARDGSPAVR